MKIAFDVTPLTDNATISHRVRGIGFYINYLKSALLEYFPSNHYIFFSRGESLPSVDIVYYPYFEPFFI